MTATLAAAPLSRVRTVLFGGLALVWFGEMLFTGIQPFAETWTRFWKMYAPDNPQLAAALYITHAFEAPLKAAVLVLALFGLLSVTCPPEPRCSCPCLLCRRPTLRSTSGRKGFP